MKRRGLKTAGLMVFFLLSLVCAASASPVTLGVAPFSITPDTSRTILEPALLDLFSSRLAMKNSVRVVDKSLMAEALRNTAKNPLDRFIEAGRSTGADYILTGSLVETDAGYTLNAYVLDIATGKAVVEISEKNDPNLSKNDLVSLVNRASSQINGRLFDRKTPEISETPVSTVPLDRHSHPDRLIKTIPEKKK